MTRTWATPLAFKAAVEQRLRNEAKASGMDLQRRRQLFVFDRFLARLFRVLGGAVVLKGGLVIELRLEREGHRRRRAPGRHRWDLRAPCHPSRAGFGAFAIGSV